MRKDDEDYFFQREETDNHRSHLRNETDDQRSDVPELIEAVFGHIPANFELNICTQKHEENISSFLPSMHDIAKLFYFNDFYCQPKLVKDHAGIAISDDVFIKNITNKISRRKRNSSYFLSGSVGCGKTAFINYIITKHGKDIFINKYSWFLRYNVDVHNGSGLISISGFFTGLIKKLKTFVTKFTQYESISDANKIALQSASDLLNKILDADKETHNEEKLRKTFVDSVNLISNATKRKFLLILDNLDFFVHENDRYLFLGDQDSGESQYTFRLLEILNEFQDGLTYSSKLSANILFVLRPESYEILKISRHVFQGTKGCFKHNKNLFTLIDPKWEDVVTQRAQLMRSVIALIEPPGKRSELSNAFEGILKELDISANKTRTSDLLGHLKALANFGLRDVMTFFGYYTWLGSPTGKEINELTTRFIGHYPIGLMIFMLGEKKLFSQVGSNFPNIFLINPNAYGEMGYLTKTVPEMCEVYEKENSAHTYWLKYLILILMLNKL